MTHFAEAAGLDESAKANLVAAFEDVIREVLGAASRNSKPVQMSIASPSGKIEAILFFHGETSQAKKVEKLRSLLAGKLDSVSIESSGETIRLSLVKNLSSARKKS